MRVCVIGAGPSGLTTVKQLADEGHDVRCFERGGDIGGIWNRASDSEADAEEMKVFDSLILTISAKLMSYSDFVVPSDRNFFTHGQYRRYLGDYADRFDLRRRIALNTQVEHVRKNEDGTWSITATSGGTRETHVFDAVAVCSGPFQTPNRRSVPDLDRFEGEVVHSSSYRNNRRFAGRPILVVGLAESGADIAPDVSDVASAASSRFAPTRSSSRESTTASTRRTPRRPGRSSTTTSFRESARRSPCRRCTAIVGLPGWCSTRRPGPIASRSIAWRALWRRRVGPAGATRRTNPKADVWGPPTLDVACEWTGAHIDAINEWNKKAHGHDSNWSQRIIFSKNLSFIPNLVSGILGLVHSGVKSIAGQRVTLTDDKSDEFDLIMLCTGFTKDFSALGPDLAAKDNNVRNLYKHAFPFHHGGRLAFIGFMRPYTGGISIVAETQARSFALLCSGKHWVPADVDSRIAREKAWEDELVSRSPTPPVGIPLQSMFIDGIAKEIGCLMPVSKLLFRPRLLVRQWFYPFHQSSYRLTGPHSDPENATRELLSQKDGPGHVISRAVMLLPLLLMPSAVRPRFILLDRPPKRSTRPAT